MIFFFLFVFRKIFLHFNLIYNVLDSMRQCLFVHTSYTENAECSNIYTFRKKQAESLYGAVKKTKHITRFLFIYTYNTLNNSANVEVYIYVYEYHHRTHFVYELVWMYTPVKFVKTFTVWSMGYTIHKYNVFFITNVKVFRIALLTERVYVFMYVGNLAISLDERWQHG